jgi:UDP-N-acetylmuramoyl-tripeptide--D-alanyl-D-alanine ligase
MVALSIKEIADAVGGIVHGDTGVTIHSVSTNSKNLSPDALFVPIIGERTDAHDFINDAFENGAKVCFTSRELEYAKDKVYIKVEDTRKALQMLGTYYRNKFSIPVIGITGSVGKTTTKEMIAAALETRYRVLKTEGNMNSQVGLPLMMLRLEPEHEIAVIEMGMSEEGEMGRLAEIARPETAVVTNIGVSHIAQLKTRENIRKEKLNIINCFSESSVLFVNGNDDLLCELIPENGKSPKELNLCKVTEDILTGCKRMAYGTASGCTYLAENIRTQDGGTCFTYKKVTCDEQKEEKLLLEEEITLQVLGLHNVYNALAALAVAERYQIPAAIAKEGLKNYLPIAMRGQIKEINGLTIIDDSYNASPDSMKSGIQVLLAVENVTRRVAVLADVKELGEISKQCHYDVGVSISSLKVDALITIGEDAAYIAQAVKDKKSSIETYCFDDNLTASDFLMSYLKPGDGILIKGSRGMKTDEIVNYLIAHFK